MIIIHSTNRTSILASRNEALDLIERLARMIRLNQLSAVVMAAVEEDDNGQHPSSFQVEVARG